MNTGVVVLCDVRGSRRIGDRAAFMQRLKEALEGVNRDRASLLGAFEVQAGLDEFAGVVRLGHVGTVLPRLWEDLHPVEVRYAVVEGSLDVMPEPGGADALPGAAGFDGPAFHQASELLNELRSGDRLVSIRVGTDQEDRLLTALGDLLYGRLLAWTERQLQVARVYRRRGSQKAAARELGVSQSTVSRILSAAEYQRVEAALGTFVEVLDHVSREG